MSINDGKKWGEDSELGKLLKAKSISSLGIKMSSENQLFSEIYTKNQLFCEFSQHKKLCECIETKISVIPKITNKNKI